MEPKRINVSEIKPGQRVKLTWHSQVWEVVKVTNDWITFSSGLGVVRWLGTISVGWVYLVEEAQ